MSKGILIWLVSHASPTLELLINSDINNQGRYNFVDKSLQSHMAALAQLFLLTHVVTNDFFTPDFQRLLAWAFAKEILRSIDCTFLFRFLESKCQVCAADYELFAIVGPYLTSNRHVLHCGQGVF